MVSFHNLGALLGRLSPRCTDPLTAVRIAAVDCIYALLNIQLRYEGIEIDLFYSSGDEMFLFSLSCEHNGLGTFVSL